MAGKKKRTEKESTVDAAKPAALCGQRCAVQAGGRYCDKPCRGYSGHEGSHQCNRGHTW